MSASPGSTLIPRVSIVGRARRHGDLGARPTATIRSPAIRTTPSSIGRPS